MQSMLEFMASRQKAILDEKEIGVNRDGVAAYNKREKQHCHTIASVHAAADKSDPFVYNRLYSHMMTGIFERSDFACRWTKEKARNEFCIRFSLPKQDYTVPMSRAIPA